MDSVISELITSTLESLEGCQPNKITLLGKGVLNESWKILLEDGREIFAKTTRKRNLKRLQFEAKGLLKLKEFANKELLMIPEPLHIQTIKEESILILPWLKFTNCSQKLLGQGLALLHKESTKLSPSKFGWESDGFIGAGLQPQGWRINWGECFVDLRLSPQLKIAEKWGIVFTDYKPLLSKIISLLNSHKPKPSLVHGDLWSGNASVTDNGLGVLIDPAVWWADREVDIAMTQLFGGFSSEFYKSYENTWPTNKRNLKTRIQIYNLYHLLNHANLFGGSYKQQCIKSMQLLANKLVA